MAQADVGDRVHVRLEAALQAPNNFVEDVMAQIPRRGLAIQC